MNIDWVIINNQWANNITDICRLWLLPNCYRYGCVYITCTYAIM